MDKKAPNERKKPITQLTDRAEIFVDQMAKMGMEQKSAARIAGYSDPMCSSLQLLQNEEIVRRINDRKRLAAEFHNITAEEIIGATALRAFGSVDDALDDHGHFDIEKARRTGAIHLVKSVLPTKHGLHVTFYSADVAQERLGNYLGLDKAPESNNDVVSLKLAVDEVALDLADGQPANVTAEIRREAWQRVRAWVQGSRARYSVAALQELAKEYDALPLPLPLALPATAD